jgi:putative transposase
VVLIPREFTVTRRNKAWVTDITYIRTWQGWLCLVVVMDLFSRKIVGWAAGPTIHRELVLDAVLMAVHRRRPRGTLSLRSGRPSTAPMRGGASAAPIGSSRA